jgi:YebC/PmpR family DNA-binding regulatory protein
MSGHSKWATIKRAKGKVDAQRGKLFNRIIREITIAARMGGGDKDANPRLRSAITNARSNNMPNKNIETAIKKGTGELEGAIYEEIVFEGYGPGGVALMIETTTDNRNRTVAEVRHALSKAGGNLGSANSVNWMFNSKGVIIAPKGSMSEDALMEVALEAGAEDFSTEGDEYQITTSMEDFETVRATLEGVGLQPTSAEITKIPENTTKVQGEVALKVMKLIDILDDLDDTQNVYSNAEFEDADLEAYNTK